MTEELSSPLIEILPAVSGFGLTLFDILLWSKFADLLDVVIWLLVSGRTPDGEVSKNTFSMLKVGSDERIIELITFYNWLESFISPWEALVDRVAAGSFLSGFVSIFKGFLLLNRALQSLSLALIFFLGAGGSSVEDGQ